MIAGHNPHDEAADAFLNATRHDFTFPTTAEADAFAAGVKWGEPEGESDLVYQVGVKPATEGQPATVTVLVLDPEDPVEEPAADDVLPPPHEWAGYQPAGDAPNAAVAP